MIVRIATEVQYELPDSARDRLNELDNGVVATVEAGDASAYQAAFSSLIEFVRSQGRAIGDDDELRESDVIVPPPDLTFEEAGEQFTGEGLIPD